MKKEIENLVNSLREGTAGKTCMGTGNFSLDIITQREYPEGFVVGKRNKFEEKVLTMEIGNTCGNVMTMLPYLGVKTFPVAFFDVSPHGYRMTRDMKAYGADVRFVSNKGDKGTTILRCMHKLDKQGNDILTHQGSSGGRTWEPPSARPSRRYCGRFLNEAVISVYRLAKERTKKRSWCIGLLVWRLSQAIVKGCLSTIRTRTLTITAPTIWNG